MTTSFSSTRRPVRPRTLRDDLLDDLRQATPMPATPPRAVVLEEVVSVEETAEETPPRGLRIPTLELRVTPTLWWRLRMEVLPEESGFVISAGPVQLSVTGLRR